jgi:hypothetical protein
VHTIPIFTEEKYGKMVILLFNVKNTLWSLNFSKIWAMVPHTSLSGCFGSINQLILLKIKHI